MTVRDLMEKKVFVVEPDDPVDRVFFLMRYEGIRHLPVVEKKKVIGIISDRDLYKALGPRSRKRGVSATKDGTQLYVIPRKARHIMRRGVLTVSPDEASKKAARMMANKKIGALPVVNGSKLVGIITATDLLRAYARS